MTVISIVGCDRGYLPMINIRAEFGGELRFSNVPKVCLHHALLMHFGQVFTPIEFLVRDLELIQEPDVDQMYGKCLRFLMFALQFCIQDITMIEVRHSYLKSS